MSKEKVSESKVKCGVIMPLSEIDGCSAGHWQEVLHIVKESLADTPFEPEMVSNADESGVIQKRIVTNLYENPIAICDVSAKNPNVMFELGMRLAFDKPTVVIKDDNTAYSFDTSPIEHIPYPRGLHYQQIVEFKSRLRMKVIATYKESQSNKDYSCFLKHFIRYEAKSIPTEQLPEGALILQKLEELQQQISKRERPIVIKGLDVLAKNAPASATATCLIAGSKENLDRFQIECISLGYQFGAYPIYETESLVERRLEFFVGSIERGELAAVASRHNVEIKQLVARVL